MSVFDFFRKDDINEKLKEYAMYPEALLVDVRTVEEYRQGHIPQAVNVPLSELEEIQDLVPDRKKKLFVYCYSGGRSGQACGYLKQWGYEDVTNIGGINRYRGKTEQ